MSKNESQLNIKDFLIGAAVGVAVGAALAYLTAPKTGREIREDISKGISTVRDKGQKIVLDVKTQSNDVIDRVTEVKDKVQQKLVAIKEGINEGAEKRIKIDGDIEGEDQIYTLK
jgi:gas vesicle protein